MYEAWYKVDRPDALYFRGGGDQTLSGFLRLYSSAPELALYPWGLFRFDQHPIRHVVELHGMFWSHGAFRDPPAVANDLARIMRLHDWQRAFTVVPEPARGLRRWVERVGFRFEGTLRNYIPYDSMTLDGLMYAVIRG